MEDRNKRQAARARRWQTERLRALIERIEDERFREASQQEIDAVFAAAEQRGSPSRDL